MALQRIPKTLSCAILKKKFGWHPANSAEVQHSHWLCILSGAAHTRGLSNFEKICSGLVRPHLQSCVSCATVPDQHTWPPPPATLQVSAAPHLHPLPSHTLLQAL